MRTRLTLLVVGVSIAAAACSPGQAGDDTGQRPEGLATVSSPPTSLAVPEAEVTSTVATRTREPESVVSYSCETQARGSHGSSFSLTFDGENVTNSIASQHGVLTLTTVERLRVLLSDVDLNDVPTRFQGQPRELEAGVTLRHDLFDTECHLALDVGDGTVALFTWNDGPHAELADLDVLLGTIAERLSSCHTGDTITAIDPCTANRTID